MTSETPKSETLKSETAATKTGSVPSNLTNSDATKSASARSVPNNQPEPGFGWIPYAEQINGRFAMIGLLGLILLEIFTNQDLWTWLGLR